MKYAMATALGTSVLMKWAHGKQVPITGIKVSPAPSSDPIIKDNQWYGLQLTTKVLQSPSGSSDIFKDRPKKREHVKTASTQVEQQFKRIRNQIA